MQVPVRVFVAADTLADLRKLSRVFEGPGFVVSGSQLTEIQKPLEAGLADVVIARSRDAEAVSLLLSRAALPLLWVGPGADRGQRPRGTFGRLAADATPPQIRAAAGALAVGLEVQPGEEGASAEAREFTLLDPLTDRELEILNLLAEGFSNPEIARRLHVSRNTIKFHVSSIIGKLGASSRTEAVTLGLRRGLIII